MKYFLDTEFSELGLSHPITLISIGIVSEDNREFYAINVQWYAQYNRPKASPWVRDNVLSFLPTVHDITTNKQKAWEWTRIMSMEDIRNELLAFIGNDTPEFWGYYADYDWVVFCQIFGAMIDLPKGWPMVCMDLKQLCQEKGNPELPSMPNCLKHHSLYDAREIKYRYDWLVNQ